MVLELLIDNGVTRRWCYFTNDTSGLERLWPILQIHLDETNQPSAQFYRLALAAAPLRELWFSTAQNFHAGVWSPPTNYVSHGDLLSSSGRVVKRNRELTAKFGIMPPVPDLGLDAVAVLPGAEIAFSVETSAFTGTAGMISGGDLLSNQGRLLARASDLIAAFGPQPAVADEGLDAVQVLDSGEIYFSVTNSFFSQTLGRWIGRGDLLSNRGVVVKSNAELLARFNPSDPKKDCGLDAIYVWPSGEIWFSVETRFDGSQFDSYAPGDLLSDQGYVVYRNRDLLAAFEPLEDLADFGLDSVVLVSDADVSSATAGAGAATVGLRSGAANLSFDWTAGGRMFQLEKATNLFGPWLPSSPVLVEPPATDQGALTNAPQSFYRLRQW